MDDLMNNTTPQSEKQLPMKTAVPVFAAMLAIILCLSVTVILLAAAIGSKKDGEPEEAAVTEAYVPVVNNRVYDFYSEGDYVFFDDPYYGNVWLPAFTDVPKHTYDYSGLVLKNGRYIYSEDGVQISRTGIDVSYHQGDIDWEKVAADGIDFAMLRLGYRGYESGALNLDERFREYAKGASDAGIDVGVYFYSQALSAEEAIEEANFVMENIRGYDITFPVVFDWEVVEEEGARTNGIEPFTVTECAAAFCDTISDGGYTPMVYGSGKFALFKLNMSKLADYDFWFAEYKDGHTEPNFPYNYTIWQYASDGTVDGIDGDVDLNICLADYGKTADTAET